jgi:manganese/zinc/iron transport system permease protein
MIIPAAAARFWTYDLKWMTVASAAIGALSAVLGVLASALFARLAAGAVIVLAGSGLFVFSMLFGTRNGVILRIIQRYVRDRTIARDHLLRALYESIESRCSSSENWRTQLTQHCVTTAELLRERSWTASRLQRIIRDAERAGHVVDLGEGGVKLTERGAALASRVVRSHRLWEIYLIEFADRSPHRVDRDADDIEHVLGPETIADLERLLTERYPQWEMPASPHVIQRPQLSEAKS